MIPVPADVSRTVSPFPRAQSPGPIKTGRYTSLRRALGGLLGLVCLSLPARAAVDRSVLPIPPEVVPAVIARDAKDSTPGVARPLSAPAGAPNILVILLDDAGYGQSGTFGGLIETPTLDRLARGGLRYTRFHVTAMCSPTRAALLTGRNHHSVGMGTISNWSYEYPGYSATIPKSAAMISEVLRENGYATAAFGKWHLIPNPETTQAGPFDHWPTHQGFDYFYGFIGGETDQWHPEITEGTRPMEMEVPRGREGDYTLNENLADRAIRWINAEKSSAPERPFFIYYAPGATHTPLQAPAAWIARYHHAFDMGWDRYRERVLERQKALGVVPADTILTPRPPEIPAWDSLTADQRKLDARLMEVFAGFMAQSDHELGRVIDAVAALGQLDNTLIFFIAGDNGASLEGGPLGTSNLIARVNGIQETTAQMLAHYDDMGSAATTPFYPAGWGWAGNTPFQWGKRIASHLGGTRDPLVVFWPRGIKDPGGIRTQFHHVIDLVPTILEATGIPAPRSVNGVEQQPIEGTSMLYSFADPFAADRHTTQYFELLGNRAIYHDGWMAAARSGQLPWSITSTESLESEPWELYHLDRDYSEGMNLAASEPRKLETLKALFDSEATKAHVFPLSSTLAGRDGHVPLPPSGYRTYTYYAGTDHLYNATAPALENRSHRITASVDIPKGGAEGVLLAFGGRPCGFSLYLKDGRPCYVYNYFGQELTVVSGKTPLPAGPATVGIDFRYDGGGMGKGASVVLRVNGAEVSRARLEHTVPVEYSYDETMDVGRDCGTPVGDYPATFAFTGTLKRVDIVVGDVAEAERAALQSAKAHGEAIKE